MLFSFDVCIETIRGYLHAKSGKVSSRKVQALREDLKMSGKP